jgi:hypothetical protein
MESELTGVDSRKTTEEPEHEKELRVVSNVSRCPFCHVPVDLAAQEWVACEGCLARHHASCWRDHGSCSACGGKTELTRRSEKKPARSRATHVAAVVVLAVLAFDTVASLWPRHVPVSTAPETAAQVPLLSARIDQLTDRLAKLEASKIGPPEAPATTAPASGLTSDEERTFDLIEIRAAEKNLLRFLDPSDDGVRVYKSLRGDSYSVVGQVTARIFARELMEFRKVYERLGQTGDSQRLQHAINELTQGKSVDEVAKELRK